MIETTVDDIDFYEIIVHGNLFRPLGWVQPSKKPKYKLVSTKVNEDGTSLAYLSDNNYRNISIVSVGDSLNGIKIDSITLRRVIMENGDIYELPAVRFLNQTNKRSKRSERRGTTSVQRDTSSGRGEQKTERKTSRRFKRDRKNLRQRWEAFQSASPEEKQRMIEKFQNQRRKR